MNMDYNGNIQLGTFGYSKEIHTDFASPGSIKGKKYGKLIKSDKIEPFRRTVVKNKIQPRMKYQNMNMELDKADLGEIHG